MRPLRGRTKKLILAFHFQFSNQAGWECESCRREGLERRRRCGYRPAEGGGGRPVWARKSAATERCPVSTIAPQSVTWLEYFAAWKLTGGWKLEEAPAKMVEAFCVLEGELRKEMGSGQN